MLHSEVSLSGVLCCSSVLKVFTVLLWVCPMHAQLRDEPGICVGSYTELKNFLPQLSPLCDSFHIFQLSGAHFLSPLARSVEDLSIFLLVLPTAALLETSLIDRGAISGGSAQQNPTTISVSAGRWEKRERDLRDSLSINEPVSVPFKKQTKVS